MLVSYHTSEEFSTKIRLIFTIGISPEEVQILQQEIHYVVHCAATVDFRERLDNAIKKNVLGTLQLFELAKTFRNLKGIILKDL